MQVLITPDPLSVDVAYRAVVREDCGAVSLFTGTVRSPNDGKRVIEIDYSAFAEMAEKELHRIGESVREKWEIGGVYIAHRTGRLKPGEISVVIAVSAPHRAEAFEACRFAIETLKKTAPIWKEEFYEEGKAWVSGS